MAVKGSNEFDPEGESEGSKHGSIRTVLHTLVGTESLLGKSAKMLDRPKSKNKSLETKPFSNYLKEYALLSEYNYVVERRIPGIYVLPSAKSGLVWFGVIFVRTGIYRGGVFRFILNIPESYPDCSYPSLVFESNVFHPSVDDITHELNLKAVFSHWTKGVNFMWQVLDYTRSIFCNVPVKGNSNEEAAELFKNDLEEFKRRVKICVEQSQLDIFSNQRSDDDHYLQFENYDETKHSAALQKLKGGKTSSEPVARGGLSWVKRGSLKPFSARPYI